MASLMRNDFSELEEDEFWQKGGLGSELFKDDEGKLSSHHYFQNVDVSF